MPKNKKSKIGNIEKLRKILDGPYDVKTSPSEGNENLESIRQRLTGESSKTDSKQSKIDTTPPRYGRMEPKVTIYPIKEEIAPREVKEPESHEETGELKDTKGDPFKDEDLYEIEKVDISEPEFLEVKSKDIMQKETEIDKGELDEKLPEWELVEEKEDKTSDEPPEFEKIEEPTASQPSTVKSEEKIPTWEPVGEENLEKEKSELTKKPTEEKDVMKARIISSLTERKPKEKEKEEKFKILKDKKELKESKESILKKIVSKKSKIEPKEVSEIKDYKEIVEEQPISQESIEEIDQKVEPLPSSEKVAEDVPTW